MENKKIYELSENLKPLKFSLLRTSLLVQELYEIDITSEYPLILKTSTRAYSKLQTNFFWSYLSHLVFNLTWKISRLQLHSHQASLQFSCIVFQNSWTFLKYTTILKYLFFPLFRSFCQQNFQIFRIFIFQQTKNHRSRNIFMKLQKSFVKFIVLIWKWLLSSWKRRKPKQKRKTWLVKWWINKRQVFSTIAIHELLLTNFTLCTKFFWGEKFFPSDVFLFFFSFPLM